MKAKRIVLSITGASGAVYGVRLARELLNGGARLAMLISTPGFAVLREECALDWQGTEQAVHSHLLEYFGAPENQLEYYAGDNLLAPVASGSNAADAMIVCPASMGTVARIACGLSTNLAERCADVMLKERRPLVLVPRETPLSEIHLENMLKLSRAGARVVPAMPGFYHAPESVGDLVDFVVGKVLDTLGLEHTLFRRWGTAEEEA